MLINVIMHSQIVMLSLILFLTDAVVPYPQVDGMANQSVTLPCMYSVTRNRGVTSMCWGRGACPMSSCADNLIWTNGYRVTYQQQPRYKLKGQIAQGNVSLTIEEATEADSGLYCCRVELRGWFNDQKITLSLKVHPAPLMVTTVATTTRVPTTTTPTMTTITHTEERIFNTTMIPTTTYAQTHKTDFPPQMESTSSIIPTQVAASSPILTSAAKPQPTTLPETETQTSSSPLPSGPTVLKSKYSCDTPLEPSEIGLWSECFHLILSGMVLSDEQREVHKRNPEKLVNLQ
ncbi:hepatitis A virus cellular receptor 1 [Thomomys bottae]